MRALIVMILLAFARPAGADEGSVAFLGIHLNDPSLDVMERQLPSPEKDRVAILETMVAERFAEEGYTLLDLTPVQKDLERVANPANCYGCDQRMAMKLKAEFILVGEVLKVSEAMIAMNLQLRDAESGKPVKAGVVDIRGNTEDTWRRGMRSILNNRFFREEKP